MRADAEENKEAIIKAAWALFAAQGPNVSRRTLAKEAGVGVGTLYRHFPEAEDLYVETLLYVSNQVMAALNVDDQAWSTAQSAAETWTATITQIFDLRIGAIGTALIPQLVTLERRPARLQGALDCLLASVERFLAHGRSWQLVREDLTPIEFHLGMATISRPLTEHAEVLAPGASRKLLDVFIRGISPYS